MTTGRQHMMVWLAAGTGAAAMERHQILAELAYPHAPARDMAHVRTGGLDPQQRRANQTAPRPPASLAGQLWTAARRR